MDEETLTYVLEAVDSVTPVTEKIAASQEALESSTVKAQAAVESQTGSFRDQSAAAQEMVAGQEAIASSVVRTKGAIDSEAAALGELSGSVQGVIAGQDAVVSSARVAQDAAQTATVEATRSAEAMEASAAASRSAADEMVTNQQAVSVSAGSAQASIDSQSISFIKQMTVAAGLHRGLGQLISSSQQLGIINQQTAATFGQINAAVGLVSASFQTLRAAQAVIMALRDAELGLAAVETFRTVLHNPAMMAVVGVGLGAAAGVGAMALSNRGGGGSSSTTVNQTVIFGSGSASDQRSMSRASFDAMGGF